MVLTISGDRCTVFFRLNESKQYMGPVRFLPGPLKISYYLSQENHFKKLVSSTGRKCSCLNPFIYCINSCHTKIGEREKSRRMGGGSGERRRECLQADPLILKNAHQFFMVDLITLIDSFDRFQKMFHVKLHAMMKLQQFLHRTAPHP